MNKIYIIVGSFSSWDSYHEKILKAFSKQEDAIKYSNKANRVLGEFSKYIKDAFEKTDTLDEGTKEYRLALNVWSNHQSLEEFNKCKIIEIELN